MGGNGSNGETRGLLTPTLSSFAGGEGDRAGHAQVLLPPDIRSEFQRVIAECAGHVADPLKFVLLLVQRAVAGVGGRAAVAAAR